MAAPYVDAEQMEAFLALSPGALAASLRGRGSRSALGRSSTRWPVRPVRSSCASRWDVRHLVAGCPADDERALARRPPHGAAPGRRLVHVESLPDLLRRAAPGLIGQAPSFGGRPIWWFATRQAPQTPIDLRSRAGWQQVCAPLIGRLLAGPLSGWASSTLPRTPRPAAADGVPTVLTAFRVRPAAAPFAGREVETEDRPPARCWK